MEEEKGVTDLDHDPGTGVLVKRKNSVTDTSCMDWPSGLVEPRDFR